MVVDGQSQQIVIEQGGITYQGQQIQQAQVTVTQFQVNISVNVNFFC